MGHKDSDIIEQLSTLHNIAAEKKDANVFWVAGLFRLPQNGTENH